MTDPEWIEDFEAAEKYLQEHTDALTNTPGQLLVPVGTVDDEKWRTIIAWLQDRGWRTAFDTAGELWFFAPGPLTDPGDQARSQN
jgi:hypothetical protein